MNDKTIIRLSIIISVIGVISLTYVAQFMEPKTISINDISNDMIGQIVRVNGTIESLSIKDGNIFIELKNNETIDVVIFESDAENMNTGMLKKGAQISITGKINFYRNSLEIVADKIA